MVQVDISQLSGECNVWRENLRNYREEFSNNEAKLRQVAGQTLSKEQLKDVEHLHNQFHIQLINIHDLKHEIKHHVTEAERHPNFGHRIPHHYIKDKLDMLLGDLDKLEADFHQFIKE